MITYGEFLIIVTYAVLVGMILYLNNELGKAIHMGKVLAKALQDVANGHITVRPNGDSIRIYMKGEPVDEEK